MAFGFTTAGFVVGSTDRDTLGILASMSAGAIVVTETADVVTSNLGIAFVSFLTGADRMVFQDFTVGVGAALAWVFAESVDAGLFRWALLVCFANRSNNWNQGAHAVFFGNFAVFAHT